MKPNERNRNVWVQVGRYTSLAFTMPAAAGVGYLIGDWLDSKLGTGYWTLVWVLIGIAAGFISLIREVQKDL